MKDLFIGAFNMANKAGDIIEATMHDTGEFAKVTLKTENGKYTISILKEKEANGNNGN